MSKRSINALFLTAAVGVVAAAAIAAAATLVAIGQGAVALGGPRVVTVDGGAVVGFLAWLALAAAVGVASVAAAIVAWLGALRFTFGLPDRTWFYGLALLGLVGLGWVAMAAYVVAGPDGPVAGARRPAGRDVTAARTAGG